MIVKDAMTPKVEWVDPEASLTQAATKMRDLEIGSLPVRENGRLIGMVTDRDITCRGVAEDLDPANTPVRKVMSAQVVWCFEDEEVEDAAHTMEAHRIHRLPVIDRNMRMVGILSLDDLRRCAPHELSGTGIEKVGEPE